VTGWQITVISHLQLSLASRKEKSLHDLYDMQQTLVSWPSTQALGLACPFLRSLLHSIHTAQRTICYSLHPNVARVWVAGLLAGQSSVVRMPCGQVGHTRSGWFVLQPATSHHLHLLHLNFFFFPKPAMCAPAKPARPFASFLPSLALALVFPSYIITSMFE
jgi:hypothetical protein